MCDMNKCMYRILLSIVVFTSVVESGTMELWVTYWTPDWQSINTKIWISCEGSGRTLWLSPMWPANSDTWFAFGHIEESAPQAGLLYLHRYIQCHCLIMGDIFHFLNIWTIGDNPPHDVWNETWTSQLNATNYVVNYVASKLPNVTIYPAIGNHGKV